MICVILYDVIVDSGPFRFSLWTSFYVNDSHSVSNLPTRLGCPALQRSRRDECDHYMRKLPEQAIEVSAKNEVAQHLLLPTE